MIIVQCHLDFNGNERQEDLFWSKIKDFGKTLYHYEVVRNDV